MRVSDPQEIYNLAAQSYVGSSFDQPMVTAQVDGIGPLRLLEIIRNYNSKIKFYQASTSELYGDSVYFSEIESSEGCQNENTPFKPNSPYAVSKLYGFQIVRVYRDAYGIFACNGILFNHESPLRGLEFVTRKITNAVARIRLGLQKELKLGNLEAQRDWGLADDYIEAMWLMLQQENPEDYVIATNETHSIKEFVEEAFKMCNLNWEDHVTVDHQLIRPKDVPYLKGDYSKAKNKLGWEPKTKFQELVKLMVEADLERWKKFVNGENFPWDAFNYPSDLDIRMRGKEYKDKK